MRLKYQRKGGLRMLRVGKLFLSWAWSDMPKPRRKRPSEPVIIQPTRPPAPMPMEVHWSLPNFEERA